MLYCNQLFLLPLLWVCMAHGEAALGSIYSFGRYYDHRKFLINCNIAVPECFDRYFSLALEDDAISTATMRKLIYEASEKELVTYITQLYQDGKIIRLVFAGCGALLKLRKKGFLPFHLHGDYCFA